MTKVYGPKQCNHPPRHANYWEMAACVFRTAVAHKGPGNGQYVLVTRCRKVQVTHFLDYDSAEAARVVVDDPEVTCQSRAGGRRAGSRRRSMCVGNHEVIRLELREWRTPKHLVKDGSVNTEQRTASTSSAVPEAGGESSAEPGQSFEHPGTASSD